MTLSEFIVKSHKEDEYVMRPLIVCADGFTMSVQASKFHYCAPRALSKTYSAMEIGFPSAEDENLIPYAETPESPTDTVYGYVPCDVIEEVIKKHGGINVEKTFK